MIFLGWMWTWFKIDYPSSWDQIGNGSLVIQRILGFVFLGTTMYLLWKRGEKLLVMLLTLSPPIWAMGFMQTKEAVLWSLLVLTLTLINKASWKLLSLTIIFVVLVLVDKEHLQKYQTLNNAKQEVDTRARNQDRLVEGVNIPWKIRRLVNNQYTVVFEDWWKKTMGVADLESLFFSEFHPLSRKNLPIFYWPEIILLPLGIIAASKSKRRKEIVWNVIAGCVFFWMYDGQYFIRMSLLFFALSKVLVLGLEFVAQKNKRLAIVLTALIFYGFSTFLYDLPLRSEFWLDNRPLMYKNLYSLLEKYQGKIIVTDMLGKSEKYCEQNQKIICTDFVFGIEKDKLRPGEIVGGFIGELVGPDQNNVFRGSTKDILENKGYVFLESFQIKDSVAYRYGQDIVIARKR